MKQSTKLVCANNKSDEWSVERNLRSQNKTETYKNIGSCRFAGAAGFDAEI